MSAIQLIRIGIPRYFLITTSITSWSGHTSPLPINALIVIMEITTVHRTPVMAVIRMITTKPPTLHMPLRSILLIAKPVILKPHGCLLLLTMTVNISLYIAGNTMVNGTPVRIVIQIRQIIQSLPVSPATNSRIWQMNIRGCRAIFTTAMLVITVIQMELPVSNSKKY